MNFREYIDHRVAELVEGGEDRPAVVARMADLAGLDPQQVSDFLAGNENECDLDSAEAYGRALELNTDEVLEVAAEFGDPYKVLAPVSHDAHGSGTQW